MPDEIAEFGWSIHRLKTGTSRTNSSFDILSAEEESALWRDWQDNHNRAAKEKVLLAHLPLCWKMASESGKFNRYIPLLDLYGTACEAMIKNADGFDPSLGLRFTTYIRHGIDSGLKRFATLNSGLIRISGTTGLYLYNNYNTIVEQAQAKNAGHHRRHELMAAWMADNTDFKTAEPDDIAKYEAWLESRKLSLNIIVDDDNPYGAFVSPYGIPEDYLESEDTGRQLTLIIEQINKLPERSREIFKARFLSDDPPTLEDLGRQFGITKERVRQLEKEALQIVRENVQQAPLPARPKAGQAFDFKLK